MTWTRGASWTLLAMIVTLGACRNPTGGAARVMQFAPSRAEVSDDDVAGGLRAVFDRDVGPPTPGPVAAAFQISPAIAGEARWLDRRTLVFVPAARLQPSTSYQVKLDRRLVTAPDTAVASWSGARFVFQRIEIASATLPGSRQFQGRTPVVTLQATQPVRASDLLAACAFFERRPDGGRGVRTDARDDEAESRSTEPSRRWRLRPAQALRPGTEHLLHCDGRFRPAAGGEGLAPAYEAHFRTAGPAGIAGMSPRGRDVSADEVKVEVAFATPMNPRQVRKHVRLLQAGGEVVPIELAGDALGTSFSWTGDLEPGSSYQLVVAAGLKDALGQVVPAEQHEFDVGDASPRLRVQRGIFVVEKANPHYPIWTRNLSSFRVRCAAVPESRLAAVLTGPASYDAWWDSSTMPEFDSLGLVERGREVKNVPERNRWVDHSLALRPTCGGGPTGVYLVDVNAEVERMGPGASLLTVTDLGLLAKVGNASSLIWVVRLSTGQVVPDALVKVRDLQGRVRFTGKSNADGVALAPGATKLIGVKPRDGEEGSEWDDHRARRVIVTAQAGDDLAVLDTNWNNGVQIWNYSVPQDRQGGTTRVRGFIHSDRGLYRPGETVHLRGLVRRIDLTGKMAVPGRRKIKVVIEDPKGSTLVDEELPVSAYGGFSRDLALPADAPPLGDYVVQAEYEGQKFRERFSVEEYRPRTFEVKVRTPRKDIFFKQRLKFSLAASYLHGSPMGGAKVTWQVRRRPHLPQFPGFEDYSFHDLVGAWDAGRYWARDEERSFSDAVADGEVALDAAGRAVLSTVDPAKDLAAPHQYLFTATVEDTTGQSVTATEVIGGHRANVYVGVHPAEWVQAVDMPFGVQVVAFDAEGKRRAAEARLTITQRRYDCGGDAYGRCTRAAAGAPALERGVAVPAAGSAAVERVVLRDPGEYLVQVTARDERGQESLATTTVYVIGKGEAFWSGDEGDRMTVIASKARYQPGETARLVPQAQLPGARALVTLERDGVLSYQVKTIASSGEAIEVPIEPRLAPNVFASVAMVRGRTGDGHPGRPRFKMGVVDLVVDSAAKRLNVAVSTDRPSYRPGERVTARVKLTGHDGAPVKGELALAVADEGVLQINGFKTPDPMPVFYASWGLGVESSTTWNRVLGRDRPDEDDDGEGGDSGGDEAGRIRSRFMATAFWKAALVTGPDGVAEVSFRAPDNLTAFRVMAVAADAVDRFGAGEQRFTVNMPLQVVAALPRFLTAGDQLRAAVVVHNNTDSPLPVLVTAAAEGVTLSGSKSATVRVPAGAARPVSFPAVAGAPGQAAFTFRVSGGDHKDAVLARLPVHSAGTPEVLLVGEGVTSGRAEHRLPALGPVLPDRSALEVSLDSTGLGRLEEGLKYLVGYPYGCLEQTTSQMVPMIALGDLARLLGLEEVRADKARGFVEAGIAKVLRHQHESGGFGLWPGTPPEVHYTAYGLWGLEVARAAGYTVDGAAIERAARYLQVRLSEPRGGHADQLAGEYGSDAFAAYVLATVGRADAGALARLHQRRQQLPIYGQAFLARALRSVRPELAAAMAEELAAKVTGSGPALLREGKVDLNWYWSSDARTTALVLSALLELRPQHPAVARLADGLLAVRVDGRWGTTQENVYGVLALAQLARVRTEVEVKATVSLGGRVIGREVLKGRAARLRLPLGPSPAGPLVVESAGGPLFYAARVRVERPLHAPQGPDRGLSVERVYLHPESGQPLTELKLGQLARVQLTVRASERLAHVAVIDHLPAGVEPVLTRFEPAVVAGTGDKGRALWWRDAATAWQRQELRDDRAELFADVLAAGTSQREYLVRAVAAGTFAAPPVTVEAMYKPQLRGRSKPGALLVSP